MTTHTQTPQLLPYWKRAYFSFKRRNSLIQPIRHLVGTPSPCRRSGGCFGQQHARPAQIQHFKEAASSRRRQEQRYVVLCTPQSSYFHLEPENWDEKPLTLEKSLPGRSKRTETKPQRELLHGDSFSWNTGELHSALLSHSALSTGITYFAWRLSAKRFATEK